MDNRFEGDEPVVQGYVFKLKVTPKSRNQAPSFAVNANPQVSEGISATGKRYFYIDPNVSTIRVNDEKEATAEDSPL